MAVGRKGKYETYVKPRLAEIDKMLNDGASEKQVAEVLGVSYASFNNYKVQYPELKAICEKPRTTLIEDLRSALVKRAKGFSYEEKKIYKKKDEDGNEVTYTEITTKYALPDVAALNLALKNYDKENWCNDPQAMELKKQELELRRELASLKDW